MEKELTLEDIQEPYIKYVEDLMDKFVIKNALKDKQLESKKMLAKALVKLKDRTFVTIQEFFDNLLN